MRLWGGGFVFVFLDFIHLFMRGTQRERGREQREKQAPCREPDAGLDPGSHSRITLWAEGRCSTAEPRRRPEIMFVKHLWQCPMHNKCSLSINSSFMTCSHPEMQYMGLSEWGLDAWCRRVPVWDPWVHQGPLWALWALFTVWMKSIYSHTRIPLFIFILITVTWFHGVYGVYKTVWVKWQPHTEACSLI